MDSEQTPLVSSKSSQKDPDAKWDEDQIVWDREELEKINRRRVNEEIIPIIVRYEQSSLGIRAHEKMTYIKCLQSCFYPN